MRLYILAVFLMFSSFSYGKGEAPETHESSVLDHLQRQPVSLFDMGMLRLELLLNHFEFREAEGFQVHTGLAYYQSRDKITILLNEYPANVDEKVTLVYRNREQAISECFDSLEAAKRLLGVVPNTEYDSIRFSVSRTKLGAMFSNKNDQGRISQTGRQISKDIEIESWFLYDAGSVVCQSGLEGENLLIRD